MPSGKSAFLFLAFILCWVMSFPQADHLKYYKNYYYEHPKFDRMTKDHQSIAIVPFNVSGAHFSFEMKDISYDMHKRLELDKGEEIQKQIFEYLSNKEDKGKLSVTVQDPQITNSLLRNAGAMFEDINEYDPVSLANLLEVDAIIMGYFEAIRPYRGVEAFLSNKIGFEAILKLRIYNAEDGVILAGLNKYYAGGLGSSGDLVEHRLVRKAAKKIPYGK